MDRKKVESRTGKISDWCNWQYVSGNISESMKDELFIGDVNGKFKFWIPMNDMNFFRVSQSGDEVEIHWTDGNKMRMTQNYFQVWRS